MKAARAKSRDSIH